MLKQLLSRILALTAGTAVVLGSVFVDLPGKSGFESSARVQGSFSLEVEPNNTGSTADSISLNSGRRGKISSTSDFDVFVYSGGSQSTSAPSKWRVDLINIPSGCDYDIRVYSDSALTTGIGFGLLSNSDGRNYESVIFTPPYGTQTGSGAAATYYVAKSFYIKVSCVNTFNSSAEYKVTLTNDKYAGLNYVYPFLNTTAFNRSGSNYGYYKDKGREAHRGLDLNGKNASGANITVGTDLRSAVSGTAIRVISTSKTTTGRMVAVKANSSYNGGENLVVTYMHMKSVSVTEGATVTASQIVGKAGDSGEYGDGTYPPHLHIQVNKNGTWEYGSHKNTLNPLWFYTNIELNNNGTYYEDYRSFPTCSAESHATCTCY